MGTLHLLAILIILLLIMYLVVISFVLDSHVFTIRYLHKLTSNTQDDVSFWIKKKDISDQNDHSVLKTRDWKNLEKAERLIGLQKMLIQLPPIEQGDFLTKNAEGMIHYARKMNVTNKAYFAYMLSELSFQDHDHTQAYEDLLMDYLDRSSVYLRENTLKALFHMSKPDLIKEAFIKLSRQNKSHSEKLLSDDLMNAYQGDTKQLLKELYSVFDHLLPCYKIAIILVMNHTNFHQYDQQFISALYDQDLSIDVKCAIIRLLGKKTTPENGASLANYINQADEETQWEGITVAAGALGAFPKTDDITKTLLKALTSSQWYIRRNAAHSLVFIGMSADEIKQVENGKDQYAKDALNFALSRKDEI